MILGSGLLEYFEVYIMNITNLDVSVSVFNFRQFRLKVKITKVSHTSSRNACLKTLIQPPSLNDKAKWIMPRSPPPNNDSPHTWPPEDM